MGRPACQASGVVEIDLRTVPVDRVRHRLEGLRRLPSDVQVHIIVGPLAVNVTAIIAMRQFGPGLRYTVLGEPDTVPRWVTAICSDDPLAVEGVFLGRAPD